MTYDNSNRKNIREAEKAAKLAESNRIAYTRHIMSDVFGRAWMYAHLLDCNVFHTPFVAGMADVTFFNCGKQNLGLKLFGDVVANCPHEYSLMMTEASIKDEVHGRRNESANDADGSTRTGRNRYPDQSGRYSTDAEGFVTDQSEPIDYAADDTGVEGPATAN